MSASMFGLFYDTQYEGGYTTKLNRNSTSFNMQLMEYFKKAMLEDNNPAQSGQSATTYKFLKYYQNLVRMYVRDVEIDSKGMLIYQTMGLGKSILAIAIAMELMKERQVILLLTKSLQENMRKAVKKYIVLRFEVDPNYALGRMSPSELESWIDHNFSFVSMNASNMLKQMSKAAEGHSVDEFDAVLEKKFGEVLKLSSLNGKLLIVDEAHNFFRAVTNGSKNAHGLYDMVMKSDVQVMFFTGTPIANDPFELVPCFNMIGSRKGKPILPESYKDFYKLFVDSAGSIKNKEKFQNRLLGLISHVNHNSIPGKALGVVDAGSRAEFPMELPLVVERVVMDDDQFVIYQLARDKEIEEGTSKFGFRIQEAVAMTKPKNNASSTYRVKSRQLSNYCAPQAYREEKDPTKIPIQFCDSPKFRKMYQNISNHSDQLGIVYSQFVGKGGLGTFSRFLEGKNWERVHIEVPPTRTSPVEKIAKLHKNVEDGAEGELDEYVEDDEASPQKGQKSGVKVGNGPGVPSVDFYLRKMEKHSAIGGWWEGGRTKKHKKTKNGERATYPEPNLKTLPKITGGGDESFMDLLGDMSSPPVTGSAENPTRKMRYAIISGDVPVETRAAIQDMYNSGDNKYGGIIDLILLSSTGAEGLDLKNVRHIHIMEPYFNWGRVEQIKARGVRNDSHIALPMDEKNVTPYIYLAIGPEYHKSGDQPAPTTDVELYEESLKDQAIIDSFNNALKEISIECTVNGEDNCRTCGPTDMQLYTDDYNRDIRSVDPCRALTEEHITAEEIIIDGTKYYFSPDATSIYDYKVFVYDDAIAGYRKIKESDPRYVAVVDSINNQPK